jgi:hypothetical protein
LKKIESGSYGFLFKIGIFGGSMVSHDGYLNISFRKMFFATSIDRQTDRQAGRRTGR